MSASALKVLVTGGTSGLGLAMARARAGSESLSRIMAADLRGTGVTVNLLLPGGATVTGMLPPGTVPEGRGFLEPTVMGPPIVWLASDEAAGVHDERIVAVEFEHWLRDRKASR